MNQERYRGGGGTVGVGVSTGLLTVLTQGPLYGQEPRT